MRYMMIMQVEPEAAARAAEDLDMEQVVAAMGAYNEELQKAGVFLTAEGLSDASDGFRVDFSSTPPVVTDGPYAEAREVFTGFWILEVAEPRRGRALGEEVPARPGRQPRGASGQRVLRHRSAGGQRVAPQGAGVARRPGVSSGRVGTHHRIPAAVRVRVAEQPPHRAGERRVLEGDLPQHPVVARGVGSRAAVLGDVLGAQHEDDELVDRREVLHEVPRVFAGAQALVDEHRKLIGRLGPEKLETGPAALGLVVRRHSSSVRRSARIEARRAPTLAA